MVISYNTKENVVNYCIIACDTIALYLLLQKSQLKLSLT
jgi:hypothetical protein